MLCWYSNMEDAYYHDANRKKEQNQVQLSNEKVWCGYDTPFKDSDFNNTSTFLSPEATKSSWTMATMKSTFTNQQINTDAICI